MSEYLEIMALRKDWPMQTVEISFTLEKGGSLALLGPSGCGKSSVLRMIAGLLAPDSGSVVLDGRDLAGIPPGRRQVGLVFQDHALFPHLSVEDNIGYGLVSAGTGRKESRLAAAEWLDRFGLPGFAKRRPDSLSGGEKQRVALARTLAVSPRLVLFDEPLSALDQDLRKRLQAELRSRQQELGYTAIYVTHDADEAAILADRIIRMR
jgi:ABC-type spermidine/putrescine transport systems, ATPase components